MIVVLLMIVGLCACGKVISPRLTEPGRPLLPRDSIVDTEQDMEIGANQYGIREDVKIFVTGQDFRIVEWAKEVFNDFKFLIVRNEENADYRIEISKQCLEDSNLYVSGFGNSTRQQKTIKAKLVVMKPGSDIERRYEGSADRDYGKSYSGYFFSKYQYEDPEYVAFKVGLIEAIGNFIQEHGISHRRPKKK